MADGDPTTREYVFGLDLIRASAVCLVIASHIAEAVHFFGVAGVELFFVLSGYLVGGIFLQMLIRGRTAPADLLGFWRRRWARTLPNYFLFLPLWLWLIPPHQIPLSEVATYAVFLQNFAGRQPNFYPLSWSLAIEEWFYIVLPLCTMLAIWSGVKATRAVFGVALVLVIGSFFLRLVPHFTYAMFELRMVVIYHLDGVSIGVLAAILAHYRPVAWASLAKLWLPALPIFLGLCAVMQWIAMGNLAASATISAISLACLPLIARAATLPDSRSTWGAGVKKTARWSYTLYLAHYPAVWLVITLPGYVGWPLPVRLGLKIAALIAAVAVSAVVNKVWEQPLLKLLTPDNYLKTRTKHHIAARS